MKFLISPITDEQENYCGTDGCFKGQDGAFYNYAISVDVDTVRISDSAGRMVPFDITDLSALTLVLSKINKYYQTLDLVESTLYEELIKGAHR